MKFIAHRINTIQQLNELPRNYGVEIDIRDKNKDLILQHDPFTDGVNFHEYLANYKHDFIILNIKSERIEYKVLDYIQDFKIDNYFFLDCSFPMIYQLMKQGEKNIALRFSEFEGTDTILSMKNYVKWVWVDCFTKFPLDFNTYKRLKMHFKLCLVSPELQGHSITLTKKFIALAKEMPFDAVCTKKVNLWKENILEQKKKGY